MDSVGLLYDHAIFDEHTVRAFQIFVRMKNEMTVDEGIGKIEADFASGAHTSGQLKQGLLFRDLGCRDISSGGSSNQSNFFESLD